MFMKWMCHKYNTTAYRFIQVTVCFLMKRKKRICRLYSLAYNSMVYFRKIHCRGMEWLPFQKLCNFFVFFNKFLKPLLSSKNIIMGPIKRSKITNHPNSPSEWSLTHKHKLPCQDTSVCTHIVECWDFCQDFF